MTAAAISATQQLKGLVAFQSTFICYSLLQPRAPNLSNLKVNKTMVFIDFKREGVPLLISS